MAPYLCKTYSYHPFRYDNIYFFNRYINFFNSSFDQMNTIFKSIDPARQRGRACYMLSNYVLPESTPTLLLTGTCINRELFHKYFLLVQLHSLYSRIANHTCIENPCMVLSEIPWNTVLKNLASFAYETLREWMFWTDLWGSTNRPSPTCY